MRALDSEEKGVHSTHTPGGQQELTVIFESGLYTLILRCRCAVTPGTIPFRFRKWVTSEVLPSIRKAGSYSMCQPETLGDLTGTATTMNVRDARRGKKETDLKAAARIAEKCVPVIMKECAITSITTPTVKLDQLRLYLPCCLMHVMGGSCVHC